MKIFDNFIILIFSTIFSCLIYFYLSKLFKPTSYYGVQKIHDGQIPRIGGLIFYLYLITCSFFNDSDFLEYFCLSSIVLFFITIKEDFLHNVRAKTRLIFCFISITVFFLISNTQLPYINFYFLNFINDYILLTSLFFIFSLLVLINGCNMIDGSNGLLNFSCLCILINLVNLDYNQIFHFEIYTLILFNIIFTFLNFPFGKIFLGDSGAYLIGFILGLLTIKVIYAYDMNTYIAIYVLIYPCFEVLFSFIRKLFYEGISPLNPDPYHIHLKIHSILLKFFNGNKFLANNITTIALLPIFAFPLISFTFWGLDDNNLAIEIVSFVFIYLILYFLIPREI